MLVPVSYLLPI